MRKDKITGDIWYLVPYDEVVVDRPKPLIQEHKGKLTYTKEELFKMQEEAMKNKEFIRIMKALKDM